MDRSKDWILLGYAGDASQQMADNINGAWLASADALAEFSPEVCHRAELWPSLRGVSNANIGNRNIRSKIIRQPGSGGTRQAIASTV